MSDPAIAALIREVLAEELQKLGVRKSPDVAGGRSREEIVTVANDLDLADLVARVVKLSADAKTRADIEQGRLVFRLADGSSRPRTAKDTPQTDRQQAGDVVTVSSGFFSERQVDQLPKGTKSVRFGKSVRLTPLARDRMRHRGISIERTEG